MLSWEQKAAAWDKAPSELDAEESLYIEDPTAYDQLQDGSFDLEKLGRMQHQAAWHDWVMPKAKRLISDANAVTIVHKRPYDLNNPTGFIEIHGKVIGDHGVYENKIFLTHPKAKAVRSWSCACAWGRYAWDRRPIYKTDNKGQTKEVNQRYNGRVCSHVLATYWKSLSEPVRYEDVDPQIMNKSFPELVEQDRLDGTDWDKLLEVAEEKTLVKEKRLSPNQMKVFEGIDVDVLNKSLQTQFDLATAQESVREIENTIRAFQNALQTGDSELAIKYKDGLRRLLEIPNVYDTDESIFYKNEIFERLIQVIDLENEIKDKRFRWQYQNQKKQIEELQKEIFARTNKIEEIYASNLASDAFSKMKAENIFEQFSWWEVNDLRRGRRWAEEYYKRINEDPRAARQVIEEMIKARIELEKQQQQPEQLSLDGYFGPSFGERGSSFISVLSSEIPIKDVVVYIQEELSRGQKPPAFVRKELWGEQRGGLCPHPDARPIRIRPDGNFIYSPDDLGYNPTTGEMNCNDEERGTYGGIPIGSEVSILYVDPRDRMAMIEYILESDSPNHSHIHIWVPLKEIDLI